MYRIALLPGDGIGKEVTPEAVRVLDVLSNKYNFEITYEEFPWSCEYYVKHGEMMPKDGIELLMDFDAILFGAVGRPDVPDHVALWGLILNIRRRLDQYVNLRPVKLLPGIKSPLADRTAEDIDFHIVRENTEGEYSTIGGRLFSGTEREMVVQESIFTRKGVDRILKYAFELAKKHNHHVTAATKSNGIMHSMPYWDERFAEIAASYPEAKADKYHIDILSAHLVLHPDWFDVIVASNLFGDILSDLGPAIAGSIGIAPSANLNPEGTYPSMFEPVHGSAPDIAGKGIANPIGAIWSAAMMLEHLNLREAADNLMIAISRTTRDPRSLTPDLGGNARTADLTDAVISNIGLD
jgi:tartrate dehydrogenase/decarboxylase/D-malate dehydrogenase